MARLGTALACLGLLVLAWGALWQLGLAPGSRVTLPAPVALERQRPPLGEPTAIPTVVTVSVVVEPAAATSPAARLEPADAVDRAQAQPRGANAVRLAIPAIKLDTPVEQGGIVEDASGQPVWQTLPFVAVHYGDLTSRLGTAGNAVIAGHVVTLSEGNVFRFLYQLDLDDLIEVWDEHDRLHTFRVIDVKLVPPSDISVMASTPDETLTLITCGGTFDPIKREFSDRLIVVAKPL